MTRLVTERASQAAVTQRAGRAARQRPGAAYRLWEEAATAGLPRFDPPEILEANMSAPTLDCALWGVADPRVLRWLDPPPEAAVQEARARLAALDALDADGRPTPHGQAIARLPLAPRLGHMLVRAGELGLAEVAAEVAVLLGERGLGGNDVDLEARRRRWRGERGQRAEAGRKLARRWSQLSPSPLPGRGSGRGGRPPRTDRSRRRPLSPALSPMGEGDGRRYRARLPRPDRAPSRRIGRNLGLGRWRGFKLDPTASLAREEWLAVAETQGMASGARILSAAAIDLATIESLFGDRIATHRTVTFDPATGGVRAIRERRLGALRLSSGPDANADPDAIAMALLEGVRAAGLARLPWSDAALALRHRAAFAQAQGGAELALDDAALLARADEWLVPLLAGKRRLDAIEPGALTEALRNLIGWDALKTIDRLAPTHFTSPAPIEPRDQL